MFWVGLVFIHIFLRKCPQNYSHCFSHKLSWSDVILTTRAKATPAQVVFSEKEFCSYFAFQQIVKTQRNSTQLNSTQYNSKATSLG